MLCSDCLRSISPALTKQNSSKPGYFRASRMHSSLALLPVGVSAFTVQLCSLKLSQLALLCRRAPAWHTAGLPGQASGKHWEPHGPHRAASSPAQPPRAAWFGASWQDSSPGAGLTGTRSPQGPRFQPLHSLESLRVFLKGQKEISLLLSSSLILKYSSLQPALNAAIPYS